MVASPTDLIELSKRGWRGVVGRARLMWQQPWRAFQYTPRGLIKSVQTRAQALLGSGLTRPRLVRYLEFLNTSTQK